MKIRDKLLITFVAIAMLFGVIGVLVVHYTHEVEEQFEQVETNAIPSLTALYELIAATRQASIKAMEYSLRRHNHDRKKTHDALLKIEQSLIHYNNTLKLVNHSENYTLQHNIEKFIAIIHKYLDMVEGPTREEVIEKEKLLHQNRKWMIKLLNQSQEQNPNALKEAILTIKSEARKVSIKAVEYALHGRNRDRDKAYDAITILNSTANIYISDSRLDSTLKQRFSKALDNYENSSRQFLERMATRKVPVSDVYLVEKEIHRIRREVIHILYPLIALEQEKLRQASDETRISIETSIKRLITLTIAVIVIALTAGFALARSIAAPIMTLNQAALEVAKGNLNIQVDSKNSDEVGELARSFSTMAQELRGAEELRIHFNSIMESSVDEVYIIDLASHQINYVNQSACNNLGYQTSELSQMSIDNIWSTPNHKINNLFMQLLEGKHLVFETSHRCQDDREYPVEIHLQIINNAEPVQIVAIALDISERKLQEEQLRHSQKMEALGKLTGGIAHDFNNLLSIILGNSELIIMKTAAQPGLNKYAKEIQNAGKRSANLTSKLLSFSRKESTKPEQVDINQIIQDDESMLSKTLTARITIKLHLADKLWPVYLEKNDLEDALLNLCINAMHAIPNRGQLELATENIHLSENLAQTMALPEGDYVQLKVTDTGHGMEADLLEKIFDPFFTTKKSSSGLGLTQVYGFIKRANGGIKIHSEPNNGTTVMLLFPRDEHHAEPLAPIATARSEHSALKTNETILLVDDEQALLDLAREMLEPEGYRTVQATSSEDALDILTQQAVDIVFSDVIMPGTDGFKLAEIVREKYPEIKIQLASGYTDDLSTETDQQLLDNILYKPYNKESLLQSIRKLSQKTPG